ncbi:hypothetical protein [Paractinoplanes globisporus]|uniref:Secreted protein n=1 Tax=Paractinoplanes globisporus TaxID=113565 RepID=A0ABW6WR15_9ACTN|nr:hypothetical protein [Actinoplanes globisporus]
MTSPQTSRRGAFVAPALLFVALLGGALFFGLLAMSGKYENGVTANNAAVTDPSPSTAAPEAKTIASTRPSHTPRATTDPTATPPTSKHEPDPPTSAKSLANTEDEVARQLDALPHKSVPGLTTAPVVGDACSPAGAKARTATGQRVICKSTPKDDETRWRVV